MTASTRVRSAWKSWRSARLEIGAVRPATLARPSTVATMFSATNGRAPRARRSAATPRARRPSASPPRAAAGAAPPVARCGPPSRGVAGLDVLHVLEVQQLAGLVARGDRARAGSPRGRRGRGASGSRRRTSSGSPRGSGGRAGPRVHPQRASLSISSPVSPPNSSTRSRRSRGTACTASAVASRARRYVRFLRDRHARKRPGGCSSGPEADDASSRSPAELAVTMKTG